MRRRLPVMSAGLAAVAFGVGLAALAQSRTGVDVTRARFGADGRVQIPVGYRHWVHIGTRYKPIGINILDGLKTATPEILNAFVEPSALAVFDETGRWPDGTQIVKEFSAVRGGHGCDENTWVCQSPFGAGIFEDRYVGLGLMVKDARRFADAPGAWGYFSFGHKPLPYDETATVRPLEACASCHVRLASDTDYVISRTHLGLAEPVNEGE